MRNITNSGSVPPPAMRRVSADTDGFSLTPKEMLGIVRRHMLLIILCTIVGLIMGGVGWAAMRKLNPKFAARGLIKVLPPDDVDPMKIGGANPNKDIIYNHRLSLATLIKQQSSLQDLLKNDKVRDTKWFRKFRGDIIESVEDLEENLGASAPREQGYIIVTMRCGSAAESALIVNEMMDQFLASQRDAATGDIGRKLVEFYDQKNNYERDLAAADAALDAIRKMSDITMLETDEPTRHTITLHLATLQNARSELLNQVRQFEATIKQLQVRAEGTIGVQVKHQIETDDIMMNLARQIVFMEADLARKLSKLGENHREVLEIRESIRQAGEERTIRQNQIGQQTRQANLKNALDGLEVLKAELERLEEELSEQEAKQKQMDAERIMYERRLAKRDEIQKQLDQVNELILKWTTMRQDPKASKVQLAMRAPVPLVVSSPQLLVYIPAGFLLGFFLGIGLTFVIELLNDTVRMPGDVHKYLHIDLLGVVPDAHEDDQLEGVDLCHVVRQAPYSIISEAYRQIRTNLRLSNSPGEKTLLITSPEAEDGKTCVAANLAAAFVAEDKRVLLIDINFCRPTSPKIFPRVTTDQYFEADTLGLSNLLAGQCEDDNSIIRHTGIEGLDVIDCGPLPSNPTELLCGLRMEQLLQAQSDFYDYILIDGPPLLVVSETKIMASKVDRTILVVNAASTRRGIARRAISELNEANAIIAGCVLFGAKSMKGGYFQKRFEAYQKYQREHLSAAVL
ncbi:MAG: polysaccharide biosynthesis tyrosine autokinase [Planctomycetota bacterium]